MSEPAGPLPPPVRVGVVGAGYFGRFHYDAWSRMPDAALVGLCEIDAARARETAEAYGGGDGAPLPVFDAPAALVAGARPDLVDVTAPPAAHLAVITALAPHVPWLICQKPFCDGLEGARAAIAIAQRHGCRIAVHENIRFQPWNQAAKALIEAGRLGEIHQILFRLRPGDGQGPRAYLDRQPYFQTMPRLLVHETAVHWIDTFRFLLGEATSVYADLRRLNPVIAGEDAGIIVFGFDGGRRAVFDGNRLLDHAADNRRRTLGEMWIEGTKATLRLDGDGRLWLRDFGANDAVEHHFDWRDHLFGGDCVYLCNRAILDAWMAGETSPMEAPLYIRNQVIEDAIYQSAETGARVTLTA